MPGAQNTFTISTLTLTYTLYTKPWPRIYGLCGEKQGARLLTRSLWLMEQCRRQGMWPTARTQSKASPFEMDSVNKNGTRAAQMQSPGAAAYRAVPAAQ